MRRKNIVILALVLCFALMFSACAARRPLQTPAQPGQGAADRTGTYTGIGPSSDNPYDTGYGTTGMGNPSYYGGYGGYGGYNNGMYGGYGNDYRNIGGGNNSPNFGLNNMRLNTTQAQRLARSCEAVPGVDSATCVISGNTCYIGVDTDGDLTGRNIAYGNANDLSAVKRQCAQKVKAANPQIQTVYVSTDANFFERLRRISDGSRNGNVGDNLRNELSELVRGLTPERL
jgi:spore cortex protein